MNTTITSTAETDRYVSMLPAEHAAFLRHLCDKHSARQAHARRMGKDRSDALQALIKAAIEHHKRQLDVMQQRDPTSFPRERTGFLQERIELDPEKYGMEKCPDRETLKAAIDNYYADS